jgi:hypothetical protein
MNTLLLSTSKMCRTCQQGQIRFITPITKKEVIRLCTECPECGILAIRINSFPSLIKNWMVFTETSCSNMAQWAGGSNDGKYHLDYSCLIIV